MRPGRPAVQPIRLRGTGSALVTAYGIADAEHLVEREITEALPDATVSIRGIRRDGPPRIVEDFVVDFRIDLTVDGRGHTDPTPRDAVRRTREALRGGRYDRVEWRVVSDPAS